MSGTGRLFRRADILKHANAGHVSRELDAETTPLRNTEFYRFELDIAEIAEVWRRSSVIGSWLLDLTAAALRKNPELTSFEGHVSVRRGALDLAGGDRRRSPMRYEFGGHIEKSGKQGDH